MSAAEATSSGPTIEQDKVLFFQNGIPSFEKYTKYRVFHKDENEVVMPICVFSKILAQYMSL